MKTRNLMIGYLWLVFATIQFKAPITVLGFDLHQILVLGAFFLVLFIARKSTVTTEFRRMMALWYFFFLWITLATAINVWFYNATYGSYTWVFGDIKTLGLALIFFVTVSLVLLNIPDDRREQFLISLGILISLVAVGEWILSRITMDGVYQALFNAPIFERGGDFRGQGGFEGPNTYGSFLNIAQVILGMSALLAKGRRRVFLLLLPLLLTLPLLWTGSRAAIVGMAVSAGAIALWLPWPTTRKFRVLLVAVVCLGLGASVLNWVDPTAYGLQRLSRTSALIATDGDRRILLWKVGFDVYQQNPVVGIGLGRFVEVVQTLGDTYESPAHNDFLKLSAETGTVGLLLLLALLGYPLVVATRRARTGSISAAMAGAGLTVFIYHEFFFNYLFSARFALMYAVLLSVAIVHEPGEVKVWEE